MSKTTNRAFDTGPKNKGWNYNEFDVVYVGSALRASDPFRIPVAHFGDRV